tara:strand:- start:219 stop:692 length:474 start_codon:yes stop_codon:yes gene_type:complete
MEPWSEDFNIIIFLPVVAALGYSLARVTALNFTNDVPTPIINLYGQLGTMLCSIFLVLIFSMWENFKNAYDIFILFIMGVAGGTGTLLLIYGSRRAELSKIMPFDYIEIFFALILGWLFFKEWPVDKLFPGVFFIIAGGSIIYIRQNYYKKQRERKI